MESIQNPNHVLKNYKRIYYVILYHISQIFHLIFIHSSLIRTTYLYV